MDLENVTGGETFHRTGQLHHLLVLEIFTRRWRQRSLDDHLLYNGPGLYPGYCGPPELTVKNDPRYMFHCTPSGEDMVGGGHQVPKPLIGGHNTQERHEE